MYTAFSLFLVYTVLRLINAEIDKRIKHTNPEELAHLPEICTFTVSPLVYLVEVLGLLLGLVFIWSGEKFAPQTAWLTRLLGGGIVLIAVAGIWWYWHSRIELRKSDVTIINPFRKKRILISDLKSVHVRKGIIVLDDGKIPRTAFQVLYRKSNVLVALLQHRRVTLEMDRVGTSQAVRDFLIPP